VDDALKNIGIPGFGPGPAGGGLPGLPEPPPIVIR
jgi:hypothetical protein